ncbi:DNA-methyltransferase, partial [Candidatus Neomarinimicrobiota bacterium]
STEFIVFARKFENHTHKFNSDLLKQINDGKRFSEVWRMNSIEKWEKNCGKHKTQKPINLLARIILASTNKGDTILDPFSGSASTGIAANLLGRKYIGIEKEKDFLNLSINRREELENLEVFNNYRNKIKDYRKLKQFNVF